MKRNTALVQFLIGSLLLSACALLAGQFGSGDHAGEVRGQRFVLVDQEGKYRAEFGMKDDGEPALKLSNKDKSASASIEMDALGLPRVVMMGRDDMPLAILGVQENRDPLLVFYGAGGERRLALVVVKNDGVFVNAYGKGKVERCSMGIDADGNARVLLRDDKGKPKCSLMSQEGGMAALDLIDGGERHRIVLQVDGSDRADAIVFGADGQPVWRSGEQK